METSFCIKYSGSNKLKLYDLNSFFYFVHSYFAIALNEADVVGRTTYGDRTFCSVIGKDNLFATQFHLEKSGRLGLRMLAAFAEWTPC